MSIAAKIGCTAETLRKRMRKAEGDQDLRARPTEARFEPSVDSAGDSYDNALGVSVIGLFKTETIRILRFSAADAETTTRQLSWMHQARPARL